MDGASEMNPAGSEAYLTEAEKAEMGALTSDLALQAIDDGDSEKAKAMIHRLVAETRGIHDSYLLWITAMQGFIYREMGPEAFLRSQVDSFGQAVAPWVEGRGAAESFRDRLENYAFMLRTHAMPLKIEEDDEKVTLMMDGCGSGARLVQNGYYDAELGGKGVKVTDAAPFTFGREDFPIYCTHCAIGQMMALDAGVAPEDFPNATIPAAEIGKDLCKFHMYKVKGGVPAGHIAALRGQPVEAPSAGG